MFLAVLSPEYLAADTCTSELTTFDTTANALSGMFGAAGNRIFTAVKAAVPASDTPEPLRGLWSTDFSSTEGPAEAEWVTGLTKLAMDLCDRIGKLQGGEAVESAAPAKPAEESPATVEPEPAVPAESKPEPPVATTLAPPERTVFLAETTDDVAEFRDGVRWDLEHQGYTVLPERNLPREEEGLRSAVTAAVGRSGLVVQLVGASYGVVPDWDPDESVVALQSDVIDELLSARPRPWIIWVSPQAEATTNQRQQGFVAALAKEALADRNTQVLRTPFETLKTEIGEALTKLGTGPPPRTDGRLMVYLICDEKDRRAVKPVRDALRGRNFNVGTPAFDHDDPLQKRREHERLLLGCDASIVFYRNASHGWDGTTRR